MSALTYHDTHINYEVSETYGKLFLNSDVALGYQINSVTLSRHLKNNSDELLEGIHWIKDYSQTKGGRQRVIKWTSLGVYHLGFFIKSKQAKEFRKFMAKVADVIDPYKIGNKSSQHYEDAIQSLSASIQKLLEENAKLQEQKNTITDKSCEEKLRIAERIAAQDAVLRPWSCEEIRVIIIGLQHVKDPSWLPHHLKKMKGETYEPNHTTQQRLKTLIEENKKLKKFYNEIKQLEI
jgi:prophage antirepressor-like protein